MDQHDQLLTIRELAVYLDVPIKTLYAWRYQGEGPTGFRIGKHVRYRWSDIEQWIRERIAVSERDRQESRPTHDSWVGSRVESAKSTVRSSR